MKQKEYEALKDIIEAIIDKKACSDIEEALRLQQLDEEFLRDFVEPYYASAFRENIEDCLIAMMTLENKAQQKAVIERAPAVRDRHVYAAKLLGGLLNQLPQLDTLKRTP